MTAPSTMTPRLDRTALIGNLGSGGICLVILASLGALPLVVVGLVYVGAASLYLSLVHARGEVLTGSRKVVAWMLPWVVAVGLWTYVLGSSGSGLPDENQFNLGVGIFVGTSCFLVWQLGALLIRHQILASQGSESHEPATDQPSTS